ncbi:sigma-70 family RNA polymerase sigma factor [Rubripirellula reticaptiva]|uniref:RNA polymerase sigma factor SigA n=1 Tax=Rubripirellula reticaptiva TaxID=2528013 RepID=A0A5C6F8P7_9BACT|nr:sigma-70 family RNA polymerase sigma factor [Rubripirellula reticaptiva]TWU55891.1 RNA polymerase sigma factor SigA [Rubripirellula reticaptiva]
MIHSTALKVSLQHQQSLQHHGGGKSTELRTYGDQEGDFFFLSIFRSESASEMLLGPMPATEKTPPSKPPRGLPAYLAHLWTVPLLTAEQEQHLFRKLNFLKYRRSCLESRLRSCSGYAAMVDDLKQLGDRTVEVRNSIVESNLRLVVSMAKRYAGWNSNEFDEIVGVGNAALVRAVDLFDFRRGVRLSTYAYQAIQTSIFSNYRKEGRMNRGFIASGTEAVESAIADAGESDLAELESVEAREQVIELMKTLDERARKIVMARFGINQERNGVAFHVIAKEIGLSTTRTAQLFHRSIAKMRGLLTKRYSVSL